MSTIAQSVLSVIVGVDTHKDKHVAVALDQLGRRLGELICPTTTVGYAALLSWAESLGPVESFGIEGTGSFGSGLARFVAQRDYRVIEVNRPDRRLGALGESQIQLTQKLLRALCCQAKQ